MAITVGQSAPEFSLYDHTKTLRNLADYRGKKVVLAFYPGAFTGVCDKEVCALQDNFSKLNSDNFEVLGISIDMPFSAKVFAERYNLQFPLLSDFNREVIKSYDLLFENFAGIAGLSSTKRAVFVLDGEGIVRYIEITPSLGVEPNYEELLKQVESL